VVSAAVWRSVIAATTAELMNVIVTVEFVIVISSIESDAVESNYLSRTSSVISKCKGRVTRGVDAGRWSMSISISISRGIDYR